MLTVEENELITRVGPGTPMGELLRRYWMPALLSEEISQPDGAPAEVRLLGEELVAFRDTSGSVGLIQRYCPHRRAALSFGRNEEGGLRCIYHGWKFGVDGACLDMPTEPEGSPFQSKLRASAYPVHEAGGIVWAYLGPEEHQPPFPDFDWLGLSGASLKVWKIAQECNFFQMIERDVDSAHISVLHRRAGDDEIRASLGGDELEGGSSFSHLDRADTSPRIEVERTLYGFRYAAIRTVPGVGEVARIYPFVFPWHPFIPPFPSGYHVTHAFVPRDDVTSWHYLVVYHPTGEVDAEGYARTRGLDLDGYERRSQRGNRYGQDRARMRTDSFSGIEGVIIEDHAIVELQGDIVDRTAEHLSTTDTAVSQLRSMFLDHLRDGRGSDDLPGQWASQSYRDIVASNVVLAPGEDWRTAVPLAGRHRIF